MPSGTYRNIERLHRVICKSLFRTDGTLNYSRTLKALERLCELLAVTDTDETVWYIGETEDATLGGLIIGAYWWAAAYHSGQNSDEYRLLSRLGTIYSPGWSSGPESDCDETHVYDALTAKAGL